MNYSREHHDPFTANSWEDIFEFRGSKVAQQLSKGAQEDTKSRGALEDAMPACPSLILCVHVPGARGELLVSLE